MRGGGDERGELEVQSGDMLTWIRSQNRHTSKGRLRKILYLLTLLISAHESTKKERSSSRGCFICTSDSCAMHSHD